METTQAEKKLRMQLQCPMPKLDFDVITLGHGSGGILTNRLLDQGVFDILKNEHLDKRHDGALLDLNGRTAFTTDSFVVNPIFFPGGDIGDLAINGTVNDLAMCGARPQYLSLGFIIEEGLPVEDFWRILVSIRFAAEEAGVKIVTGDTKVVERGKGDGIFINTSGVGSVLPGISIDASNIQAGDAIIVSGELANHGIAIMSVREGLEFETDIVSDTRAVHHQVLPLLEEFGDSVKLLRDPTRGGVATVLNEIARDTNLGIDIMQKDIPVDPQVEGACELLGLDPLYVANEGLFLAVVDGHMASTILERLRQLPGGEKAAQIATVGDEHRRQVFLKSRIGGRRVVNMLVGEQLPRIC